MELWDSLTPDQRALVVAMLTGWVVTGLFYVMRHLVPTWFTNAANAAKFKRTLAAVLTSAGLALIAALAQGQNWVQFLFAWVIAYSFAEGAHTVISRTSAAKEAAK